MLELETAPPAVGPIEPAAIAATLIASRQAADAICDRWSLLVVCAALEGSVRFSDFAEASGMANRLLTARLKSLQAIGVLAAQPYSLRPLRHEYRLTPMGEGLADVVAQMERWEGNWDAGRSPAARSPLHCSVCGQAATARDIDLRLDKAEMQRAPLRLSRHRRSTMVDAADVQSPLRASLGIFGDRWGIEILLCAFFRVRRFNAFRHHTGIAANILSDRLGRLTAAGVLTAADADRRGYRLTEKGIDLYGSIVAIQDWADAWLPDRYRSPVKLIHRACGAVFHPEAALKQPG